MSAAILEVTTTLYWQSYELNCELRYRIGPWEEWMPKAKKHVVKKKVGMFNFSFKVLLWFYISCHILIEN